MVHRSRAVLHGFWYGFGAHDGYNLWEAPDNVSMAAVALALSGGGAISSLETTVLHDRGGDTRRAAEGGGSAVPTARHLDAHLRGGS